MMVVIVAPTTQVSLGGSMSRSIMRTTTRGYCDRGTLPRSSVTSGGSLTCTGLR